MTGTHEELHERLAPLRQQAASSEDEIAQVLAAAAPAPSSAPAWRRPRRLALGVGAVTAAAAVAVAALPSSSPDERGGDRSGVALLDVAAAKAAEQPAPVARYRYARERSIYNRRVDTTIETWVDRGWHGRQRSVALHEPGVSPRPQTRPAAEAFDRLPPRLDGLPTEPRALRDELLRRWRADTNRVPVPGLAPPEREALERDQLIHELLILLTVPNATPELRSALWGVLKLMPGVERAPDARDPLGRDGEAVRIPVASGLVPARPKGAPPYPNGEPRVGAYTIVFDPKSSELLFWSLYGQGGGTPDQTHTIEQYGYVDGVGQRP
jgi:hypothetical protein